MKRIERFVKEWDDWKVDEPEFDKEDLGNFEIYLNMEKRQVIIGEGPERAIYFNFETAQKIQKFLNKIFEEEDEEN